MSHMSFMFILLFCLSKITLQVFQLIVFHSNCYTSTNLKSNTLRHLTVTSSKFNNPIKVMILALVGFYFSFINPIHKIMTDGR